LTDSTQNLNSKKVLAVSMLFLIAGAGAFVYQIITGHAASAWQAYLVNFCLFSGMAAGGLTFSATMWLTRARWTGPLSGLAESFAAFFPLSLVLFICLLIGKAYVFPWRHMDLHGKEIWLNIPFLFGRDALGLLILYSLGFLYIYDALRLRMADHVNPLETNPACPMRRFLLKRTPNHPQSVLKIQRRLTVTSGLYIVAFALVLSLLGYDLVMSADPHWVSTLFGAYTFVKAFYVGLGGLIILASFYQAPSNDASGLTSSHFHDAGKLFFAFCMLWADFFYVQFLVIWYGNLPEETSYIITRTMTPPWNGLAWVVFAVCFVAPFLILLNKTVKTKPAFMRVLCFTVIVGIWLEHYLLLAPALQEHQTSLPLGMTDALIFLGFLGMMTFSVTRFLNFLPELLLPIPRSGSHAAEES
jgi:Ni/Fe-hydrogenase subunit HybB-like protein